MKYITIRLGILVLSLAALNVGAVTIHECVDEKNETTFQDTCPPGSESVNTFILQTSAPTEITRFGTNITLYSVPDCESCDITRNVLTRYDASFNEINIKDSEESRTKLRILLGSEGDVSVPTVIFGEKQIVGFNKATLISELEAAGFEEKGKKEGADQAAEVEIENESDDEDEDEDDDEDDEDEDEDDEDEE